MIWTSQYASTTPPVDRHCPRPLCASSWAHRPACPRWCSARSAVAAADVAAIISYQHAYELVSSHGEQGVTTRLLPFTVDGE